MRHGLPQVRPELTVGAPGQCYARLGGQVRVNTGQVVERDAPRGGRQEVDSAAELGAEGAQPALGPGPGQQERPLRRSIEEVVLDRLGEGPAVVIAAVAVAVVEKTGLVRGLGGQKRLGHHERRVLREVSRGHSRGLRTLNSSCYLVQYVARSRAHQSLPEAQSCIPGRARGVRASSEPSSLLAGAGESPSGRRVASGGWSSSLVPRRWEGEPVWHLRPYGEGRGVIREPGAPGSTPKALFMRPG